MDEERKEMAELRRQQQDVLNAAEGGKYLLIHFRNKRGLLLISKKFLLKFLFLFFRGTV